MCQCHTMCQSEGDMQVQVAHSKKNSSRRKKFSTWGASFFFGGGGTEKLVRIFFHPPPPCTRGCLAFFKVSGGEGLVRTF